MGIEKIMHMQEELIKGYKKQIVSLEKENPDRLSTNNLPDKKNS